MILLCKQQNRKDTVPFSVYYNGEIESKVPHTLGGESYILRLYNNGDWFGNLEFIMNQESEIYTSRIHWVSRGTGN